MRIFILLQLSISFILGFSCSHHPKSNEDKYPVEIAVNVSQLNSDSLNLSEIADRIEYIPLETSDSILIDGFPGVDIMGNDYFVQCGKYRFDSNGDFLNYVYCEGQGPEEVIPRMVAVNELDTSIYVYNISGSINVYSNTGQYKYTIKKDFSPPGLIPDYIVFYNKYLFITNSQVPGVKTIYSCYDFRKDTMIVICNNYRRYTIAQQNKWPALIPWEHRCQIEDSLLLYKENFSDTIFTVDTNLNKRAKYIINLGRDKLEWETWRDTRMFIVSDNPPSGYGIQSFYETESNLIFTLTSFTDPGILAVYNKKNHSTTLFPCNGDKNVHTQQFQQVYLRNDLDGIISIPLTTRGFFTCHDGNFYVIINAMDFAEAYASVSEKIKNSTEFLRRMRPIFSRITENSNPVILKIHLR